MFIAFLILVIITIAAGVLTYFNEKFKPVTFIFTFLSMFTLILGIIERISKYNPLVELKKHLIDSFNKKFLIVTLFFTFLSMFTLILVVTEHISLDELKKHVIDSYETGDTTQDVDSIEIHLPIQSNPTQEPNITPKQQLASVPAVTFLNVDDQMYRNENGMVHIEWTPITTSTNYKLKIEIDDPFTNLETNYEYLCDTAQYDFDASAYTEDTTFFISVAIFDKNSSKWIYSEPLSFILK